MKSALLLTLIGALCLDSAPRYSQGAEHAADKSPTNVWTALVESEVNPRGGAGLV